MTSLPRFSVQNPVLVGVAMVAILIGGAYTAITMVREMFPESRPLQVRILTPYPGATPAEVEKGVAVRLEEAIKDIEHIDKMETAIEEGSCVITVSMTNALDDLDQAVNDFKAAVDAIPRDELPEEMEEIRVMKFEPKLPVIAIAVYGDADETALKSAGRKLRDELLRLPDISDVDLSGTCKSELTVEVQPEKMTEYGLSLGHIGDAIARSNLDLPGGQLRTSSHNVAVRTLGETDEARRIGETIIRTTANGQVVRVRDVGRVIDGFEDVEVWSRFNGHAGVELTVYKTTDQDAIQIARQVKAFVAGKQGQPLEQTFRRRLQAALGMDSEIQEIYRRSTATPYPPKLQLQAHTDLSRFIEGRLELLTRNGLWGAMLVFLSLLAFLNWRVALWVMMGLLLSLCGALILLQVLGESLNLVTMFGLIVVLGLIVDDAIVVGENIYAHVEGGAEPKLAAIHGAEEVTWPVTIAVATTVGAFFPLLFIEGRMGDFFGVLPVVVMCALCVSLLESLTILPSHLADGLRRVQRDLNGRQPPRHWLARWVMPLRRRQKHLLHDQVGALYEAALRLAVRYRYVTLTAMLAVLIVTGGLVAGRRVPFVFIQKADSETIIANLEMPVGTPAKQTQQALEVLEQGAMAIPEVATVYTVVGMQIARSEMDMSATTSSHLAQATIELLTVENRDRTSEEIIGDLREITRRLTGVRSLKYQAIHGGPGGAEIVIEVTGEQPQPLADAVKALKTDLLGYQGVYDISDDSEGGRRELQIELLDSARPLGLTTRQLATEVRGAFYGLEPRTLQRDREDVDIRVRFPRNRRRMIHEVESLRIATPSGQMVPFSEVARLRESRGYATIRRVNQRRAIVVSADVDQDLGNAEQITAAMAGSIRNLERRHPGLQIQFSGDKRETTKSFGSLKRDFVFALIVIYVMLAGLFRSYVQPLIVLSAVPFGLIGAIGGHFIMGYPLTILSLIGLVALTGIVVNDSLILVNFTNLELANRANAFEAVIAAGRRRLRPILLTSLTTILGLAPLMAEQSFQAKFLIPMAVSISFGLAFATVITLVLVPSIYMIVRDVQGVISRVWYGPQPQPAAGTG